MIGWILGGLAVATIGKALMDDAGNNSNRSDNNGSDNNIMWIQCPFCNSEMSINQSLDRRHITCAKCQKKFVVDRRIPINNLLVVQCVSCGRDVEVPGDEYVEAQCDYCGAVFTSDRGTVYRKKNLATSKEGNKISENHSSIINEPRGNNTNLEERFVTAYEYLCNTTAKDIAIRTSIYGAYVNMYLHENFAHDYYLDIVAALCGPFKFNALIEDKIVMKMLNDTMYGFVDVSSGWITPLRNWIVSNGGYKCDDLLSRIIAYLDQGKGNEILEQFNYIVQVVQPDEYTYFPEMNSSMNRYSNSSTWPRI